MLRMRCRRLSRSLVWSSLPGVEFFFCTILCSLSGVEFALWCGVLLLHRPLLAEPETETQRVMQRENLPRGLMQISPLWFSPSVSTGCRRGLYSDGAGSLCLVLTVGMEGEQCRVYGALHVEYCIRWGWMGDGACMGYGHLTI